MTQEHLEVLLHLAALPLDEPVPPFGVLHREVIVWLVTVANRITECSKRRENVKRVPDAKERLVGRVGRASLEETRLVRLDDPDTVINMTLSLQAHDLQKSTLMDVDRTPSCNARDLLDIAPQERVARARVGSESNAAINRLTVKEAELFVPNPVVLLIDCLVTTDEHLTQFIEINSASSGWNDSAGFVASVANGELFTEALRVAEEAFLFMDSVAIAVLVCVDEIFAQQTNQDCDSLVDIVHCPAVSIVERDEDLKDSWRSA